MTSVSSWARKALCVSVFALAATGSLAQDQGDQRIIVRLADGTISLAPGVADGLQERFSDLVDRRSALSDNDQVTVPVIVTSSDPAVTLEAMSDTGLQPVERLAPDAYVVQATREGLDSLTRLPGVNAVDLLPTTAKIAATVNRTEPFEWQLRDGGTLAYSVRVYPGTTAEEIEALQERGLVRGFEDYDRGVVEIVRVLTIVLDPDNVQALAELPFVARIEPAPPPDIPDNEDSTQPLSNVDDVQIAPYNLSGAGINVGVWEATETATNGFGVLANHESLTGRVTVEEASNASNHATHVAGTIASSGVTAGTEGMAPAAGLSSYGSGSDATEMTAARLSAGGAGDPLPILISNHSYGIGIGWNNQGTQFTQPQAQFGQYTNLSAGFDNVVVGTDLVVVKSAGNHRNDQWNGVSTDPSIPNPVPGRDCTQNGFAVDADCLSPRAVAKNIITVGAVTPGGAIAGFSSFGPTDDGRIKPDLMANGTQVDSTGAAGTSDAFQNQGTSMATPAVSGVAALLLEEAEDQSLALSAAAVKAILINTAQDVPAGVGQAQNGPDYATGWGIVDAQAAVDLIRRPAGPGVAQETLAAAGAAGAYTQAFIVPSGAPDMRVTLAWTDPAGSTTAAQNLPRLVNDLDLRLIDPTGNTVQPWALNPANPGAAAVANGGDDTLNNVEQVFVAGPAEGIWQVQVTAKTTSFAGPQDFAIAGPFSPITGPITSDPADIMLVLDRSGSMNSASSTPGISKLGALKSAAEEMANYLEIVGGHQLGIVQFSSNVGTTNPVFNLQPLDSTSIGTAEAAIGNLTGSGSTNIIAGVTEAATQLAGGAALNTRQAVILFSDGKHNSPSGSDVADIDTAMANDTLFYAIGFGTDVDSTVMPGVAANHNGIYLEEQSLSAAELSKLFLAVAGVAIDETIVVDPDYVVQPGGFASQSVVVGKHDRAITFATHWNTTNPEQFALQVVGPDDRCIVTEKGADGAEIRRGDRYALIRIAMPFKCPFSDSFAHEGEWRLHMRSRGTVADTAKVVVLSNSALTLNLDTRVNQRKLTLVAWLERDGEVVIDGARMRGFLTVNRKSTGDSASQDETGSKSSGRITAPGGFVLDSRMVKIDTMLLRPDIADRVDPNLLARISRLRPLTPEGNFAPKETIGLELRDDGREGDEVALDGRYTAVVELDGDRLYGAHVTAHLPSNFGPITREALTSVLVK